MTTARPSRLPWWAEAGAILVLYFSYEWARGQVQGPRTEALSHARQVIAAERFVDLYHEATVQHWFLGHTRFLQVWNVYYGTAHFVVPIVALVVLWRRFPWRYARWRWVLVVTTLLALVGFAFYPLMPPRLLPGHYHFVDTAAAVGGMGPFDSGPTNRLENLYAAMPSLHVGWSAWCSLALLPVLRRPWTKALVAAYPFVTLFAIVVTANHYVLDGVGAVVLLAVAYGAVWAVSGRLAAPVAGAAAQSSPEEVPSARAT